MAKLKNGSEEASPLITATMMSLYDLMKTDPIAFVDLATKCKDPNYKYFPPCLKILQDLSLVQEDEKIHGSIQNIVLSAITGDGLGIELVSPLA